MLCAWHDGGRSISSAGIGADTSFTIGESDRDHHTILRTATLRRIEIDSGLGQALESNDGIGRIGRLPHTCRDGKQNTNGEDGNYLFHYAKKLKIEAFIAILAKNFFAKNAKGYRLSTCRQLL